MKGIITKIKAFKVTLFFLFLLSSFLLVVSSLAVIYGFIFAADFKWGFSVSLLAIQAVFYSFICVIMLLKRREENHQGIEL